MKKMLRKAGGYLLLLPILVGLGNVASAATPAPPTDLKIAIVADESIPGQYVYRAELSWTASASSVSGYNVYVKKVGADQNGTCNPCVNAQFKLLGETKETSFTVIQGEIDVASAAYTYYVTAVDREGESEPSNMVSSVCGRDYNDGDISEYIGSGITNFVSDPPPSIRAGAEYIYDADVVGNLQNQGGERIAFMLVKGPQGMTIDEETGLVTWMPTEPGMYFVTIEASAPDKGESDRQTWGVEVTASQTSGVAGVAAAQRSAVYPNPVSSRMTIRFVTAATESNIRIVSADGRELFATTMKTIAGENALTLDVDTFAAGAYFARISNDVEIKTIPFTVAR